MLPPLLTKVGRGGEDVRLIPGYLEIRAKSWSETVLWRHLVVIWEYSPLAAGRTGLCWILLWGLF